MLECLIVEWMNKMNVTNDIYYFTTMYISRMTGCISILSCWFSNMKICFVQRRATIGKYVLRKSLACEMVFFTVCVREES